MTTRLAPFPRETSAADKILASVRRDGECWIWLGGRHRSRGGEQYGHTNVFADGKWRPIAAHRLSYIAFVGPIPADLCVCHRCDIPLCVNPEHLFVGTHADNKRDAAEKGRLPRGERASRSRLNSSQVVEIRRRYAAGNVTHRELADEYGVRHSSIGNIVRGGSWSWLGEEEVVTQ